VLEAAKKVNYMPRISTRRVNIGLVVQDIEHANQVGYVSDAVSTLSKHMALRGGVMELVSIHDPDAIYRNYIRGLIAILFDSDVQSLSAVQNIPVVAINNDLASHNFHTVASDHAQGTEMATRYLAERGHKKIGFMEMLTDAWGSTERRRGYIKGLNDAGIPVREELIAFTARTPVREALSGLLQNKITALLVCGEDLSLQVNQLLLHDMKVKIPDDLSLITYETPLVSGLLTPPQTTVCQPWEQIGRAAVDAIFSLVEHRPGKPLKLLFPNRLIERCSVKNI
jgi:LacI family transcriptional regulator